MCQWHTSSADRAEGETLDRSEAERRAAQPPGDQAETEGKRPNVLTASQRDNKRGEAVSEGAVCQWHTSSADRAEGETLDRSEAGRRAAQPPGGQAETEGKRPNILTASQRDNNSVNGTGRASALPVS